MIQRHEAEDLVSLGCAIIPIHECDGVWIGKEPLTENGFKDATKDKALVFAWWRKWPQANVGIKTGKASGFFVLDVDLKNNGPHSLELLEKKFGKLPETVMVNSGGGGTHYYFKYPNYELRGRLGMKEGLDVKAEGGGIVAPPSNHFSGKRYEWVKGKALWNLDPVPAPEWLLTLIKDKKSNKKTEGEIKKPINRDIEQVIDVRGLR